MTTFQKTEKQIRQNAEESRSKFVDKITDGPGNQDHPSCDVSNSVFTIDCIYASSLQENLQHRDETVAFSTEIHVAANITWHSNNSLTIISRHNLIFLDNVHIANYGNGTINLIAGFEGIDHDASVNFADTTRLISPNVGRVKIYYNPQTGNAKHKYHNPGDFYSHSYPEGSLTAFMWINNMKDLQDIRYRLYGNFALSRDIGGDENTIFKPIGNDKRPFSGNLDGSDHTISDLHIIGHNQVAIFGLVVGTPYKRASISHLKLQNIKIEGLSHLGILTAEAQFATFNHIHFKEGNSIKGKSIAGSVVGSGSGVIIKDMLLESEVNILADEFVGIIAGALRNSYLDYTCINQSSCIGYALDVEY